MQINWNEIVVTLIAGVMTYIAALIRSYVVKHQTESKIFNVLAQGIEKAEEDFVRDARLQGPLTQETINKARDAALAHAIELAQGPIKDKILAWTKDEATTMINKVLKGVKL